MPIAVKRRTIFEDWAWDIKYAITGTARAVGTAVYNMVRIKHKKKYPYCAKCEDCLGCTCSYCKKATKCYTYEKLEYYDNSYKVDFNGWFDAYVSKDYLNNTLKMTQEEYVQYIMGLADKEIAERGRATCISDQFVIGTLMSNKEEYSNLVSWLKELQERRNAEVGLFYEEKAKRQAEQS